MATSKILKYPEESMVKALKAVADGISFREAAQRYSVPKTTLLYKFNGKHPLKRKMGPSTVLTAAEEKQLADWVIYCADIGFPVTKLQLIDSVELLLKELKRETMFTNNRPGRAWYDRFLERSQLSERMAQNLTKSRAAVTESNLRQWFKEVENHLISINALDVLKNPSRIYNMDESGFHLTPEPGRVLVKKGTKAVYSVSQNDEKECLTVLLGSNGDGIFVPPMVVFPYIRLPPRIAQSAPTGWGIGKSESGWMFGELFLDYIVNVFHPWLVKNGIQLPIILFIDGHVSHLTMALSLFCRANGIILFSLYPNATHIYQPMDIGLFHVLKDDWKVVVYKERMKRSGAKIQKEVFCSLLLDALVNIDSIVLRNSFRASGLYPFDADAVDYSKLIKNTMESSHSANPESSPIENTMGSTKPAESEVISTCEDIEEYRNHLVFIEKWIDDDTLSKFKSCGDVWNGSEDNKNLFEFWHKIFKVSYVGNSDHAHEQPSIIAVCNNEGEIIVNGNEHFDDFGWDFDDEEIDYSGAKPKRAKDDHDQRTEASKSLTAVSHTESSASVLPTYELKLINQVQCTTVITGLTTSVPDNDLCTFSPNPRNVINPLPDAEIQTFSNTTVAQMDFENEKPPHTKTPSFWKSNQKKINKKALNRLHEYFEQFEKEQETNKLLEKEKLRRKQQREKKATEKLSSGSAYSFKSMERGKPAVDCRPDTLGTEESVDVDTTNFTVSPETFELNNNCESATSTSTTIQQNVPEGGPTSTTIQPNVPDSFQMAIQKVLFTPKYPEKKDNPKATAKAKPIHGITSDLWVEYFQSKEDAKKKIEEDKRQRKIERENKRKEAELMQLQTKELRQKQKEEREEKKRQFEDMKLQKKLQLEEKKKEKLQFARKSAKKQQDIVSTEVSNL